MRSTDRQYKMHFISNIYRFIFFLILLAITIIGIITYYNFSRQNHTYSINYNMSAVSGLTHMIEEQEDSFMQCINNAYLDYYSYREGLFFISPDSDAPIIRENCYRFLSESFSLNQQITSMSIYSAYDNRIYSVTKTDDMIFRKIRPNSALCFLLTRILIRAWALYRPKYISCSALPPDTVSFTV
ncbi:MAG: hypothetical protein ACLSGB_06155 [Dorea sp.]